MGHLTALIDINAMIVNKQLKLMVTYSRRQLKPETAHAFVNRFETIALGQDELELLF